MFAILKNFSQFYIINHSVFINVFRDICIKLLFYGKQFLYIIGLHWAVLGFLAVAPLFCMVRWNRGMDVNFHLYFTASFGGGCPWIMEVWSAICE